MNDVASTEEDQQDFLIPVDFRVTFAVRNVDYPAAKAEVDEFIRKAFSPLSAELVIEFGEPEPTPLFRDLEADR